MMMHPPAGVPLLLAVRPRDGEGRARRGHRSGELYRKCLFNY